MKSFCKFLKLRFILSVNESYHEAKEAVDKDVIA